MKNKEECPCCPNHCKEDSLGCARGRDYFSNENNTFEPKTITDQVIIDLRKCGHILHHNRDLNTSDFLSELSEEELNKLHELLSKIHSNI